MFTTRTDFFVSHMARIKFHMATPCFTRRVLLTLFTVVFLRNVQWEMNHSTAVFSYMSADNKASFPSHVSCQTPPSHREKGLVTVESMSVPGCAESAVLILNKPIQCNVICALMLSNEIAQCHKDVTFTCSKIDCWLGTTKEATQ